MNVLDRNLHDINSANWSPLGLKSTRFTEQEKHTYIWFDQLDIHLLGWFLGTYWARQGEMPSHQVLAAASILVVVGGVYFGKKLIENSERNSKILENFGNHPQKKWKIKNPWLADFTKACSRVYLVTHNTSGTGICPSFPPRKKPYKNQETTTGGDIIAIVRGIMGCNWDLDSNWRSLAPEWVNQHPTSAPVLDEAVLVILGWTQTT